MKVKIEGHNLISLLPQSDADLALLGMWAEMKPFSASCHYEDGKATEITISFHPIREENKEANKENE